MAFTLENNQLRLLLHENGFTTQVYDGANWHHATALPSRPLDALMPDSHSADSFSGNGVGYHWRTQITPKHGGFWLETMLEAETEIALNPASVLWIGLLDALDERQAHTWRQTILRAPTVNQQGLGGNDLPACYLYDHSTCSETVCYFAPDAFVWSPRRFYDFALREVIRYHPVGCYGVGLCTTTPDAALRLSPGTHRFAWWFTQRYRAETPSNWEAQRILIETAAPLLNPVPRLIPDAIPWHEMAQHTLHDLADPACWIEIDGVRGLRAYVRGSSAVKRDEAKGFELMTQLDVLWPLLLWQQTTGVPDEVRIAESLEKTLNHFERHDWNYVANNFPPRPGDSFMDTWYFLENALIKLPWVAYLTGNNTLKDLFLTAMRGAQSLASNTNFLFPLFADANGWQPRHSLLNVSVGGLYAAGCVIAAQLDTPRAAFYLSEAAAALRTLYQLPPHQLTHEPQQLSFAAAAASYLARHNVERTTDWMTMAADFVGLTLRMGYWGQDPSVPFYDPRGMFQACASLSYPAYKENVETLLPWLEVLRGSVDSDVLIRTMAAFANLQRCHNTAFFDPYLPAEHRHGPCAYIPYEDLATHEFQQTAKLGKELYGAGEVFWSALLFDALGTVDQPDILCLCLDVPSVELRPIPPAHQRRYLLYNPSADEREIVLQRGEQADTLKLASQSVLYM